MATSLNIPATARSDRSNCAVVAFAAVLGAEYLAVRDELLANQVYHPARGSSYLLQLRWMKERRVMTSIYPGRKTLAAVLREADPRKTYVIYTKQHCQALVRGKHVNTCIKPRSRVHGVFEITERPTLRTNRVVEVMLAMPEATALSAKQWSVITGHTVRQVRNMIDRARRMGWDIKNNRKNGTFHLVR